MLIAFLNFKVCFGFKESGTLKNEGVSEEAKWPVFWLSVGCVCGGALWGAQCGHVFM